MKLILSLIFAACFVVSTEAAQNVKTVNGVPIANVKTVNGVAVGSVKTVLGVDNTGGGGITPPTLIQVAQTASWNSSTVPLTTTSFSVQVGDRLVAYSVVADFGAGSFTISNSSTALTWTQQQNAVVTGNCPISIWSATCTAAETITVTFNQSINFVAWGGAVLTFRGSTGFGASNITQGSGQPSLAVTTTANNSVLVMISADWNAIDGTVRTYRTINGVTPVGGGSGETTFAGTAGSTYQVYGAYWSNCGTAGSKTVGLTAPIGQQYNIAALEVKGT